KQIIQMASEAGAKKVYFCSAAPAVRYPNVYGIDMPSAHELIAHGRSTEEVAELIGADWLIYQDLDDLKEAVGGGKVKIEIYPSMSLGGAPPELISQVRDGVVDLIWTVNGYTPGLFPRTEVFELPFIHTNDIKATNLAIRAMFDEHLAEEY
ncbi:MAG: hypothetical protein KO540_26030, partial [Pseudomonas indica]|nr:hypothetical protein [Pseudomonas indica]